MHEFRAGVADRGASVRIPRHVAAQGYGYLEDRRPAANADPYLVSVRMLRNGVQPRIPGCKPWLGQHLRRRNAIREQRCGEAWHKRLLEDRCAVALSAACNWRG